MKIALITGITGQDGSYLAEFLLNKNYKVIGFIRRSSTSNKENIKHILDKVDLVYGDLSDSSSIKSVISKYQPDEIYNLAAQSFVHASWKIPEFTADVNAIGPLRILEAIKEIKPDTKFYQASTSEMFGKVLETPQNETTPFYPRSPYGVSKVFGHHITINYRESYNLFASCGILFNHESPRRGIEFVSRKITRGVAKIELGLDKELRLGNLDAKRDWGYAKDYVEMMWKILQYPTPEVFVIGSEETHSIEDFCDLAFRSINKNYRDYVVQAPEFYRPAEVDALISDCTKAKKELDWKPGHNLKDLVEIMVMHDIKDLQGEINGH
jgi:GDPmannose 4,6-dehydratase